MNFLEFSPYYPEWFNLILNFLFVFAIIVVPVATLSVFTSRKLAADFQARVGPNRVGPKGLFQPLVDFTKLIGKRFDTQLSNEGKFWFFLYSVTIFSSLVVVPIGSTFVFLKSDINAFLPIWLMLLSSLVIVFLGFSKNTVSGTFGGFRAAFQMAAGVFPAIISTLCVGLEVGSFNWLDIVSIQKFSPMGWIAFSSPFHFLAFNTFFISGLVMMSIPPFDSAFSSSDIKGGMMTELSGYRLILFLFCRVYSLFMWSLITIVFFCGGWKLPGFLLHWMIEEDLSFLKQVLEIGFLLFKTFILVQMVTWMANVNPRLRVDQTTDFSWKILGPLSLLALIGVTVWTASTN